MFNLKITKMKNKSYFKILLTGIFLLTISAVSFAQDQYTNKGAVHVYNPTVDNSATATYSWSANNGAGVVMSGTNNKTATITFTNAGSTTVTMVETNDDCSTTNTFTVTVVDLEISITDNGTDSYCSDPSSNAVFKIQLVNAGLATTSASTDLDNLFVDYRYSYDNGTTWQVDVLNSQVANGGTINVPFIARAGVAERTLKVEILAANAKSATGPNVPLATVAGSLWSKTVMLYDKPAANAIVVTP